MLAKTGSLRVYFAFSALGRARSWKNRVPQLRCCITWVTPSDYQQVISESMSSGSSLSCFCAPHVLVDTMDSASDWCSLIGEIEAYSYTNRSVSL
jgi:hypothetical protein